MRVPLLSWFFLPIWNILFDIVIILDVPVLYDVLFSSLHNVLQPQIIRERNTGRRDEEKYVFSDFSCIFGSVMVFATMAV
jgi:hypothetical protein